MPSRNTHAPTSLAWLVLLGGVAISLIASYNHLPGVAALWASVVIAAFMEPMPVFTGPKDSRGFATAQGARELADQRRFHSLGDLKWRLLTPNMDWLPGWPIRGSWTFALAMGVLATALPVESSTYRWVNAVAAFIFTVQMRASLRRFKDVNEPRPALTWAGLGQVPHIKRVIAVGFISAITAAVALPAAVRLIIQVLADRTSFVPLPVPLPVWVYSVVIAVVVFHIAVMSPWANVTVDGWSDRQDRRQLWEPVWASAIPSIQKTGAPRLVSTQEFSQFRVDTFEAPGGLGANGLIGLKARVIASYGAGESVVMLAAANVDAQGQPMPGTQHPTFVDIMTFPSDSAPDPSDGSASSVEAGYGIMAALSLAVDAYGSGGAQYLLAGIEPLHVVCPEPAQVSGWARLWDRPRSGANDDAVEDEADGEPHDSDADGSAVAAWAVQVAGPNTIDYIRTQYAGMMLDKLAPGNSVLVNSSPAGDPNRPGGNRVYVGALDHPDLILADESTTEVLRLIELDDTWRARWKGVLKTGVNFPELQNMTLTERVGNAQVQWQPFVILRGEQVDDFRKLEPRLATTMQAASFVSIVSYPGADSTPGSRHPQAFVVVSSSSPVPTSADKLPASQRITEMQGTFRLPEHWVLAGQLNAAFDSAKLPRPELAAARPLTPVDRRMGNIWKLEVRLYDGVTLMDVRQKMGRIMSTLGVPWAQVTTDERNRTGFVALVIGEDYRRTTLASRDSLPYLQDLEWQQAWADAKLVNPQGLIPTIIESSTLPANDKVYQIDFRMPSGLTAARVKASLDKLKGSTKNAFAELRPGEYGADSIRLLVCTEDPMPFPAPIDFDYVDASAPAGLIPFATGVEGEPISWNVKEDPHLLIVGGTGSGKSSTLQMLMYPIMKRGWDLFVIDPVKGAADFTFARPWTRATATTTKDASALMDAVYAEVMRRRDLNTAHGVASYVDLPEQVRPRHAVVMVDEFTSLIIADKVTKPQTSDPVALEEYAERLAHAELVYNIGTKVGRITREARSAGVTLVLSAQRLTAEQLDSIPGGNTIRTNMSRLILGKTTFGELQSALRSPESAPDIGESVPLGRGLIETSGSPIRIIQSWYDHPIQEVLSQRLSETPHVEPLDLSPFLPKTDDIIVEGAILNVDDSNSGESVVHAPLDLGIDLDDVDPESDDDDSFDKYAHLIVGLDHAPNPGSPLGTTEPVDSSLLDIPDFDEHLDDHSVDTGLFAVQDADNDEGSAPTHTKVTAGLEEFDLDSLNDSVRPHAPEHITSTNPNLVEFDF